MKDNTLNRSFGFAEFGQTDVPHKIGVKYLAEIQVPECNRSGRKKSDHRSWKSRRKTKWR